MNKRLLASLCVIIALTSCQKNQEGTPKEDKFTIKATIQSISVGENIRILYEGGSSMATAVSVGEEVTFELKGTLPEGKARYIAVYPSTQGAAYIGGNLELFFSDGLTAGSKAGISVQIAAAGSVKDVFRFKDACSYVKFKLSTQSVYEARLYADGALTGSCTYTFNNKQDFSAELTKEGKSEMRVLLAPDASDSSPYVAPGCTSNEVNIPIVPCSTAKHFTIRMKDINGWSFPSLQFTADGEFAPGSVLNLGEAENQMKNAPSKGSTSFRAMSFNILRGDTEADHLWPSRKEACLDMFRTDNPDIFGLQECNSTQRYDLLANLPQYAAVGVSWMGDKTGSYTNTSSNTIFYRSEAFELVKWGTYWNSPEPDRWPTVDNPNPCWYYSKTINTNWAVFKIKGMEKNVVFICSHMVANSSGLLSQYKSEASKYSSLSKQEALKLLASKIGTVINRENYPMIYVADFNCSATESYCSALRDIMVMTKEVATVTDNGRTVNNFGETSTLHYDHIFCNGFNVPLFSVDSKTYAGVKYISDHYPVYADLEMK